MKLAKKEKNSTHPGHIIPTGSKVGWDYVQKPEVAVSNSRSLFGATCLSEWGRGSQKTSRSQKTNQFLKMPDTLLKKIQDRRRKTKPSQMTRPA